MPARLCLNELSLRMPNSTAEATNQSSVLPPLFSDRYKAREALAQFIAVVIAAHNYGAEQGLCGTEWDALLAPDYRLAQWRADREVVREQREHIRLWQANRDAIAIRNNDIIEYRYDYNTKFPSGQMPESVRQPPCLSIAAQGDEWIAISLLSSTPTEAEWDVALCRLAKYSLETNTEELISVAHAARESHLLQHVAMLPRLAPAYVRDNRQAHDDETFLRDRDRYQSTGFSFHSRVIYQDHLGNYYHVDNLHRGRDSHIEYYGPSKAHLGTLWPDGSARSGPKPNRKIVFG